jgi:hypothetical protein
VILSGLPMLSLNLKRARTYAERMLRHVVVGNLARSDAWDALAIPLAASHRSFALSVVGEIVEGTAGYPYFLQFFGAYVCRSVASPDVSLDQYRAVEPALLHELDLAFFQDRFEGASPAEQRVLEAMARVEGRVPSVGSMPRCLRSRDSTSSSAGSSSVGSSTGRPAVRTTSRCRSSATTSDGGPKLRKLRGL